MITTTDKELFHLAYIVIKLFSPYCVFPTVRTVPLLSVPAGYMDICMSTRWQGIFTLLLASMYLNALEKTLVMI